jgi:predicted hotdog family 3-hydroxylacyl-ACP dehydratase
MDNVPIPAAQFLPHKPPMAMIDSILEIKPNGRAMAHIRPENRFLNVNGILDRTVIPELVGQANAAINTCRNKGVVAQGFLALARDIQFFHDIHVNDEIIINLKEEFPVENWVVITFDIHTANNTLCAKGEISICLL